MPLPRVPILQRAYLSLVTLITFSSSRRSSKATLTIVFPHPSQPLVYDDIIYSERTALRSLESIRRVHHLRSGIASGGVIEGDGARDESRGVDILLWPVARFRMRGIALET